MKQILLLLSLFFAVSVNAQKKIIVTGGGGGTPVVTAGDGITISGDSIYLGGEYKDDINIYTTTTGKTITLNNSVSSIGSRLQLTEGSGSLFTFDGTNSSSVASVPGIAYLNTFAGTNESQIQAWIGNTTMSESWNSSGVKYNRIRVNHDNSYIAQFIWDAGSYTFPRSLGTTGQVLKLNGSNLEWANESGSASNWPTINDTLASDTSRLTITGTGLAEIGGAFVNMSIAGDEIKFTSTLVENKITTTDQSFRTGSATENGRLYITSNYAQLSARNAGGVTSNFTAFRNYAQIASADSLKITGLQEKAIDTLDYQLVIDANNRVHKVKRQVLLADSTLTITEDSIKVNRAALLGYREYVALLYYTGSPSDTIIAEVIYNDLGFDIDWLYDDVGNYSASYVGGTVDVNKISISFSSNATGYSVSGGRSYHTLASVTSTNGFSVYTRALQLTPSPEFVAVNSILQKNGDDGSTFITIRVYN